MPAFSFIQYNIWRKSKTICHLSQKSFEKWVFRKEAENPQELAALGRISILTEEQENTATMFIASLYGRPCCTSLNSLITEKAASSINIASKKLSQLKMHCTSIYSTHCISSPFGEMQRLACTTFQTAWFWENWNYIKTQDDDPESSCFWAHGWTLLQMPQQWMLYKLLLLGKPANVHSSLCLFRWQ